MLIGNLGNDPEMRYSASGTPFLRMNVASNYRTRTPGGEYEEKTEWVRATITGARAESLSQYLKKGSRVYVDGRLEARPWTDQHGQMRAGLEVMANEVEFLSSRSDEERTADGGQEGGAPQDASDSPNAPSAQPARGPTAQGRSEPEDSGEVEDLPF
jgi:single-strand DNA-binding protein